ncbi:MAG: alpha/beta hydrolase [Bacteroidia bacterium]|nr:alpha/beta hydrolase [Bacteroidia bacterium]
MLPLIRQLSNARSRYFLTSSGMNIEYRQKGDPFADTIVMLHGVGADCRIFLPNIDKLAERFHVLAVSLRGHGLSDKPRTLSEEAFSMDLMVRDLIELTWSLGVQSFHLVGHGIGAVVGYELLTRDPNSLLSLTSMAAPAGQEGLKGALKILQKATGLSTRILGNHVKQAEVAAKMCSTDQQVVAFLKEEVFYATDWSIAKLIRPLLTGKNYLEILAQASKCPILFIMGEDDSIEKVTGNGRAMQETIEKLKDYPHVSTASIPGAGYFPNLDQPNAFFVALDMEFRKISQKGFGG